MNDATRKRLAALKHEASFPKRELLGIERRMREISPRQADRLGAIISRLEHWQNTTA
jgi:hypothetical protein